MGMFGGHISKAVSSSIGGLSSTAGEHTTVSNPPYPDPFNFEILKYTECNNAGDVATVVEVRYPDATSYEGRKIIVYPCGIDKISSKNSLDPHFSEDKFSPIARLRPTEEGWKLACLVAYLYLGNK